ncbi:cytochrome P450 [Rhizopus microsporus]|uniref:Cytochrome P450 n=1 Tax=Rhizopus microsporus TaxID=58291 RepID=A0A1X0S4Z7_RHIZD|nr:cytochrome P450 [Rhizopus microsporus]
MEVLIHNFKVLFERMIPLFLITKKKSCIGVAVLLVCAQQVYSFFRVPKKLRHIPAVSAYTMIKSTLRGQSRVDCERELLLPVSHKGNGIYLSKATVWTVHIADPVAAKQFLMRTDVFPKVRQLTNALGKRALVTKFLGQDNILLTSGHQWKKQRALMNPVFHRSMPIKAIGEGVRALFSVIDKKNGNINVTTKMQHFTLDVLGITTFAYRLVNKHMLDPLEFMLIKWSFLLYLVIPEKRRAHAALAKLNAKFDEIVRQRRAELESGALDNVPENEKDLITLMLEAEKRGEAIVTEEQLRHNIAVIFVAGHETISSTLSLCLYNLAKYKHVQAKLRKEVIEVLGNEPVDVIPTLEELRRMEYLNMVIKENLRLYGPSDTIIPREATKDFNLIGTFVPKGTLLNLDIGIMHCDSHVWKNPEEFIPERFGPNGIQVDYNGFTYLPFSNGSRQCIGMNFSLAEQRIFLAMTVKKYEIEIAKDSIH